MKKYIEFVPGAILVIGSIYAIWLAVVSPMDGFLFALTLLAVTMSLKYAKEVGL